MLWFIINHNAFSDCCQFSDIHISQGSVATYLGCGIIFKYESVVNLPPSLSAKFFKESVNIWRKFRVLFFWLTVYNNLSTYHKQMDPNIIEFVAFYKWPDSALNWWHGGTCTAFDLQSKGRTFDSRSVHGCVTTLGKLFMPMCLDTDIPR